MVRGSPSGSWSFARTLRMIGVSSFVVNVSGTATGGALGLVTCKTVMLTVAMLLVDDPSTTW